MAIEANVLAEQHELRPTDRRQRTERRGRDRRKAGSRVNVGAPTRSLLRRLGLMFFGLSTTVIAITLAAAGLADLAVPTAVMALEIAAWTVSIIIVALGSIEQRLMEVRLELMMLNGGRRKDEDRRQATRRTGP